MLREIITLIEVFKLAFLLAIHPIMHDASTNELNENLVSVAFMKSHWYMSEKQ